MPKIYASRSNPIRESDSNGWGSPLATLINASAIRRKPMSPTVVHECRYAVADDIELAARRVGFEHCPRCGAAMVRGQCLNC